MNATLSGSTLPIKPQLLAQSNTPHMTPGCSQSRTAIRVSGTEFSLSSQQAACLYLVIRSEASENMVGWGEGSAMDSIVCSCFPVMDIITKKHGDTCLAMFSSYGYNH